MADIKHDPDPLITQLRNMAQRENVFEWEAATFNEAADEIERLRALCNDLHHDATCHKSFCRLCGEGISEWDAQRKNGGPLTAEQCAEWAQANVDALGLLVKPQQPSTLRRFIAKLKKEARRG